MNPMPLLIALLMAPMFGIAADPATSESAGQKTLRLPFKMSSPSYSRQDPRMALASDGQIVFVYDPWGLMHRISTTTLTDTMPAVRLQPPPAGRVLMAMTSDALALWAGVKVALLDPELLKERKSFSQPQVTAMAGCPSCKNLFVATNQGNTLAIIDTKSGDKLAEIDAFALEGKQGRGARARLPAGVGGPLTRWSGLALSPDGQTLYCGDGYATQRLRVTGTTLTYETSAVGLGRLGDVVLSPGGRYTLLTQDSRTGSQVYETKHLDKPVLALPISAEHAAFDQVLQHIYLSDFNHQLVVYDGLGTCLATPKFDNPGGQTIQIIPLIKDGAILVLTAEALYRIDMRPPP